MSQQFIVAQISDLHIKAGGRLSYRKVDTLKGLYNALERLNALVPQPDVVVITGDLVDFGRADEYACLKEALSELDMPYYLVPGNHDNRQAMRAAFPELDHLHQQPEFVQWCIEDYPVRMIGLDSTVPGAPHGELCAERLAWLESTLSQRPNVPTLVMLHHPPFASGIGHMDRQRLMDSAGLAAVISRHPQVERVLCGHLHRSIQQRFAGSLACCCPGTAHQVVLDIDPDAPAHFVLEPPGYLLHVWTPEQAMITHMGMIEHFDGPYPFFDSHGLID
ncbi:3',5'-cyclic-nucleotide phosphodiesterase [Marinobacterium lacunae]|uniref:3',5'-cyclic-nucleotide phosphodiesterase n=1 Tax=Marinobacterium lacunae TaxID=1232683 RepID=A0A081FY11_9GAMM|nr:phosphodiesterase [Marinobacterium lacunae]KEA63416.1 3',5'-cyclic-nucleotide phosphodiesterase [Marinobacterium lacunae]